MYIYIYTSRSLGFKKEVVFVCYTYSVFTRRDTYQDHKGELVSRVLRHLHVYDCNKVVN